MADCIERERAYRELDRWLGYLDEDMVSRIKRGISRIPSAGRFPMVQCKDCKHAEPWYRDRLLCFLWNEDAGNAVFENGFCSYGERKGEP